MTAGAPLRQQIPSPWSPRKDPGAAQPLSCPLVVIFQNFAADYAAGADILHCMTQ